MTPLTQLRKELKSHAQPERAKFHARFFKTGPGEYGEGDKFLGLPVPKTRKVARQFRELSFVNIEKCLASKWHEERFAGLLILVDQFKRAKDEKTQKTIYQFLIKHVNSMNNWDLVDTIVHHIIGVYLFERDRKLLYQYVKSKSLWKRRIAIISTYYFIKEKDFDDTLALAEILLHDKEDLIHKAVGWMLREVGNRDRKTEEAFLKKHYKTMPRTMLRYAIEKFPETLRKKYLHGKI